VKFNATVATPMVMPDLYIGPRSQNNTLIITEIVRTETSR
jgi:hypothetical protein